MSGRAEQLALVDDGEAAAEYGPPPTSSTPIATSGRTEYTAHCPHCQAMHRHTSPGPRRAPCGATYTVTSHNAGPDGPGPDEGDSS